MKLFFVLIASALCLSLNAQNNKYFNIAMNNGINLNSNGRVMCMNNDGTYFIAGDTRHNGLVFDGQPFFIRTNNQGSLLQFNELIDTTREAVILGLVTIDSLIFGAGYENLANTSSTYYVMMKKDGSGVHEANVGDTTYVNSGYTACRAHDGGFLIGGEIQPYDPPNGQPTHPYLVKLDSAGNKLWDTIYYQYGPPAYAWFWDMKPAPNGNGYYLLGTTKAAGYWANILLLHINEQGTILWDKIIDLGKGEFGRKLLLTNDGGYLLVGYQFDANYLQDYKGLAIKLDSSRNITWINDTAYALALPVKCAVEVSDGYVLGGVSYKLVSPYDLDACITKLNFDGSLAWQRTHDRAGEDDYTYDMLATPDGSYLLCGRTESYDDTLGVYRADVLLLKANCMGLLTQPQASYINSTIDPNYLCVFQNTSQFVYPDSIDGGHYLWQFGDGATSTELNPTHTYTQGGNYTVTLTAIVCSDTSVFVQEVSTWAVGVNNNTLNDKVSKLYPNPSSSTITFTHSLGNNESATCTIYDASGRLINSISFNGSGTQTIDVANYSSGLYYYTISVNTTIIARSKLVIIK